MPIVTLESSVGANKLNTGAKLRLGGTVALTGDCNAVWTVDDMSVDLERSALLPTRLQVTDSRSVTMVLAPYSLPPGVKLTFSLTCSTLLGQVGTAKVTVVTNSPPLPGVFFVDPSEGVELADQFRFTSSMFSDDDMPITYQYGFLSRVNTLLVVQTRSESAFAVSQLPAGSESDEHRLLLYQHSRLH